MTAEGEMSGGASDVVVRQLAESDIPAVSAILSESPGAAAWSRDSLCQSASGGSYACVAEQAAGVVGFLIGRIVGDEFEVLNLAVARTFRRCGIASKLLKSALEFSRISGARHVYLEVRALNEPAVGLYTRHGFTNCGRRSRYYRNPTEDALLFSREIGRVP
jgi:ribosomal-protein-alanine N-acetyltransferase